MRLLVAGLLVLMLLSGCAGEAPDAATPARPGDDPDAAADAVPLGNASKPMRFAAADHEATVLYDGAFTVPDPCLVVVGVPVCERQVARIDLSAQVPADAPVDLAITASSDACLDLSLEVEQATLQRYEVEGFSSEPKLAASLLRTPAGVVTLVVDICSFLAGDPGQSTVPFTVEARSVVRAAVLPVYLPVVVELSAGDRLEASGSGLDSLLVAAPGQPMVEVDEPYEYEATGAGRHMVIALGSGDVTLRGAEATLVPLARQLQLGEPRPLSSGQEVAWDFTVPGVPLFVGIRVAPAEGPTEGVLVVQGNLHVRVTAAGQEVVVYDESFPVPGFSVGGGGLYHLGAGYDPALAAGTFSATVMQEQSAGTVVQDYAVYVLP